MQILEDRPNLFIKLFSTISSCFLQTSLLPNLACLDHYACYKLSQSICLIPPHGLSVLASTSDHIINTESHALRGQEDQATAIGNKHKKFGEDQTCSSGDMTTDRETDRHTHSSQYFTLPCWERSKKYLKQHCKNRLMFTQPDNNVLWRCISNLVWRNADVHCFSLDLCFVAVDGYCTDSARRPVWIEVQPPECLCTQQTYQFISVPCTIQYRPFTQL